MNLFCVRTACLVGAIASMGCESGWSSVGEADPRALLGAFAAEAPLLDGVGALLLEQIEPREGGRHDLICSGTLINATTVLTAKHCLDTVRHYWDLGYRAVFSLGGDVDSPRAIAEVVEVSEHPHHEGGFNGRGRDVGVAYLAEPIGTLSAYIWIDARERVVGERLIAVGYGDEDWNGSNGRRKAGQLTVRAVQGYTYEALVPDFRSFYRLLTHAELPSSCEGLTHEHPEGMSDIANLDAGVVDRERPQAASEACREAIDAWRLYRSIRLEDANEMTVGGHPGDAQPCYGDSGGPLLGLDREGTLRTYGVISSVLGGIPCAHGAIAASFDESVMAFLEEAMAWSDPCARQSELGTCDGNVAVRCTSRAEGNRRLVRLDCEEFAAICAVNTDGRAACGKPP